MKGLPYFKWYPADAETDEGYQKMTDSQLGFYHRCLNKSWINNGLPYQLSELAQLMKESENYVSKMWLVVGKKFEPSPIDPTRLVNRRQEDERSSAMVRHQKASNAAHARHGKQAEAKQDASRTQALPRAFDSDSDSKYLKDSKKQKTAEVQSPLESAVLRIALVMHERHPAVRRCGIGEVQNQLRAIVRKIPAAQKLEALESVNRQHEAWCATDKWQEEGGQYAKGLDNWLAPTKRRWEDAVPDQVVQKRSKAQKQMDEI